MSSSLISLLTSKLERSELSPPLSEKSYLRASSLYKFCPREESLVLASNLNRMVKVPSSLMMTFALGTGLHYAFQNEVLSCTSVLLGKWKCTACGFVMGGGSSLEDQIPKPYECSRCSSPHNLLYEEQLFTDETYRVTGHPDGFLKLDGEDGVGLLELKSTGQGWLVSKVPMHNHVIQVQTYMWLTGTNWARIVYWDKAKSGMPALKEYHIRRDNTIIDNLQKSIKSYWDFRSGGCLPDRICKHSECERALECSVVSLCFGEGQNG